MDKRSGIAEGEEAGVGDGLDGVGTGSWFAARRGADEDSNEFEDEDGVGDILTTRDPIVTVGRMGAGGER